jgi:RimJ/RimL family protein N-acetyltransferase
MALQRMTMEHVPDVCEIHRSSWGENEVSVKLGAGYLRRFYSTLVQSPHGFGYVYLDGGKIAGYASGFSDYEAFNAELKSRNFVPLALIAARGLATGRLRPGDLRDLMADGRKLRKLRYPKHHWGAMALANEHKGTPLGRETVLATVHAVFDELAGRGCQGVWGACDDRNVPMKKYLGKLGFDEVDAVEFSTRVIRVYEKPLGAATPPAP